MGRKVFVSYSHILDQDQADQFGKRFADQRDVFIDKSIREDIGHQADSTIKSKLSQLIKDSTVNIVLIGKDTGGRHWVDWEIYHSLRASFGNGRNGLLGVLIPNKQHWIPQRLTDNITEKHKMGKIIEWPRDYRTLQNAIEDVYEISRSGHPYLSKPLRQINSYR